ncbi:MAG: multidrug efflux pump [Candidatus Midichloriaceae bacterium]|jgi:multidrug efflux pump|nr:multidrug efflux pump [Candidatus Midichloriaceae bacterium]
MWLSDTSVKRPILAAVLNIIILVFGVIAFSKLPLREYPDIDPPIVSIVTTYKGASAAVIENQITEVIEARVAGIEGIKSINSQSTDGKSDIEIEFYINRNINDALGDIRDVMSSVVAKLPKNIDPPEISKSSSDEEVVMWVNFVGAGMSTMELTEYANLYIKDKFSTLDGVSRARIGGALDKSMRVWLKTDELAARNLTVADVEKALNKQNVDLPAGILESKNMDFTVRLLRNFNNEADFKNLPLSQGTDGHIVKLSDVATVELAPAEARSTLRSNGSPMVSIGIIKQSKANTLAVAKAVKKEIKKVNRSLPENMRLELAYDSSIFVDSAVKEVFHTLVIAVVLVVLIIFAFLGNVRAMLIPALTVPVSLIGTFIFLYLFGYTVNLLTLLALILAIGLVVDDAIVVVENIHSRMEQGEEKLLASFLGTRQVGFAVVATTLVLIAVFLPLTFLDGNVGRLFGEFAVAMSAAILLSGFCSLTFVPMLASKILDKNNNSHGFTQFIDDNFTSLKDTYIGMLKYAISNPLYSIACLFGMMALSFILIKTLPSEFSPKEDRGYFRIDMKGPEGASYNYMLEHVNMLEERIKPLIDSGEFKLTMLRVPGSFSNTSSFNNARGTVLLNDWAKRKPIDYYMQKVRDIGTELSGVKIGVKLKKSLGGSENKPVQFVIGGPDYSLLAQWRDIIVAKASENQGLFAIDYDYIETKPQLGILINLDIASTLGVDILDINEALETLLGTKKVTTFESKGEELDVILESEKAKKQTVDDIKNIYVRSARSGTLVPLSSLISFQEFADAPALNRYNKMRSITIEANLAPTYSLKEALNYLENLVRTELPKEASIDYKGESLNFIESSSSMYFIFLLSVLIVFLVLAAQFESLVHPFIIIFTVPLASSGALVALYMFGQTLNIYSQIGLIILVGISTKNGILIVEFANQLRAEGAKFEHALIEAAGRRLRPIIMTTLTTALGAVPLILASGAGSESRSSIGTVIFWGVIVATFFTIFIIPVIYSLLARNTTPPNAVAVELEKQIVESSLP